MMATERERVKALVATRIEIIAGLLRAGVKAKDAYRQVMAELEKQKNTYTPEYIASKREEALKAYQGKTKEMLTEMDTRLDALGEALLELHGTLNLENPALANALKLIELSGKDLDVETIHRINASFVGDQPALRALIAVYKRAGTLYNGGLENQVYDVEDEIRSAKKIGREGGSLNTIASQVWKIASLEGLPFEKTPDPQGVEEAWRQGAGLPVWTAV